MPAIAEKAVDDDARGVAKVFNEYAGVKSYLSRDVDGRVVRIDTFSKVFGPGMRTVSLFMLSPESELARAADRMTNRDGYPPIPSSWNDY